MNQRRMLWYMLGTAMVLFGCSNRPAPTPSATGLETTTSALSSSCANGGVIGFESPANWNSSSGTLASSTDHTEGGFSLAVQSPTNYTTIVSQPLTSADTSLAGIAVGSSIEIDLKLPVQQPNPFWFGAMQIFVSAPSRGVYNQYLGQVELTGRPLGVFQTLTFAIPDFVANALHGQTFNDLTFTVVLNVPSSGTGTYLLDNFRVKATDGSPANVRPKLACVASTSPGHFEALFGYADENSGETHIPIGTNNRFLEGTDALGQPEDFVSPGQDAVFAVAFDGTPLAWSLAGGCVVASAQSPACATTTCFPGCRHGEQCVNGHCVSECNDGLCAGDEGCGTCAPDCGCGGGKVCFQNGCAAPVSCGIDWECGAGVSFGVSVDCGPCATGTCINHVCQ